MTGTAQPRQASFALASGLAVAAFVLALVGIDGQTASADETARASATATVTVPRFEFKPATVTISRGSKVRFSNTSGTTHTATRASFDTGRIKPGASATIRFNQKGTFPYHCNIHSFMKGKVVVD